ncbi:MAG: hypothetical protein IJM40_02955 [Synergistaceae bacterium]|nr:hypothetical protein [Synergistaceae bacterium]
MSKKFLSALMLVLLLAGLASAAGRAVWSFNVDNGISSSIAVASDGKI